MDLADDDVVVRHARHVAQAREAPGQGAGRNVVLELDDALLVRSRRGQQAGGQQVHPLGRAVGDVRVGRAVPGHADDLYAIALRLQ